MEKKPRAHAATIVEWANGAKIEYRHKLSGEWVPTEHPAFVEDYEYRVKPVREYPEIALQDEQLVSMFEYKYPTKFEGALRQFANSSIRCALNLGQVVTREEFKRVSDEANKAVRSLNAYGYTDEGGDMWKPPLGDRWPRDRLIAEHVAIAVEAETRNAMQAGRTCKYSLDEIIARANK